MGSFDFEDEERPQKRRRVRRDEDYDDDDYDRAPRRSQGGDRKSRLAYILLALFFGELGVHNFYAGRTSPGICQLVIFLVSIPLMFVLIGFITVFIPIVWALIEIIVVDRDGRGVPMT
ncbi:MAG TPA: TM2 domain-containing protein [Gemmata sp.]